MSRTSPKYSVSGYPTRYDLLDRPQAIRRRDAIYCLDAAANRRLSALRCEDALNRRTYIRMARDAIANARRYDAAARKLGFFLPGPVLSPDSREMEAA